jgi:hypothetical protein
MTALHEEMRVRFGDVPHAIDDVLFDEDGFVLSRSAFLFATDSGVRFHYTLGRGITAFIPSAAHEDEFRLYLWGTVFGAVGWLNGYFPLHASAVAVNGRAVAFTADSGVGKSTLAAALSAHGLPHVCDDTLPVLVSQGPPLAIPDRKPLKLWEDAFALVAAERLEPITSMPGKSYALTASRAADPLPLADLVLLENGDDTALTPVRGADKLAALVDAMYRDFIPGALGRRSAYHRDLLALANGIGIWRLTRPRARDVGEFRRVTERIAHLIGSLRDST